MKNLLKFWSHSQRVSRLLKRIQRLESQNLDLKIQNIQLVVDKLRLMDNIDQWEKNYRAAIQEMIVKDEGVAG